MYFTLYQCIGYSSFKEIVKLVSAWTIYTDSSLCGAGGHMDSEEVPVLEKPALFWRHSRVPTHAWPLL